MRIYVKIYKDASKLVGIRKKYNIMENEKRLEAFESMLLAIQNNYDETADKM